MRSKSKGSSGRTINIFEGDSYSKYKKKGKKKKKRFFLVAIVISIITAISASIFMVVGWVQSSFQGIGFDKWLSNIGTKVSTMAIGVWEGIKAKIALALGTIVGGIKGAVGSIWKLFWASLWAWIVAHPWFWFLVIAIVVVLSGGAIIGVVGALVPAIGIMGGIIIIGGSILAIIAAIINRNNDTGDSYSIRPKSSVGGGGDSGSSTSISGMADETGVRIGRRVDRPSDGSWWDKITSFWSNKDPKDTGGTDFSLPSDNETN